VIRALLALAALAAAPAAAQQPAPATQVPAPAAAVPRGSADQAKASAEHLADMRAAAKQVGAQAEAARAEKDVVKLNCVYEKLAQMKAFLRVAEQSDLALAEAIARKDPAAERELSKIGVARAKVDTLRAQAEKCVGQLAYAVEERTRVEVEQPAGLPEPASDREDDRPSAVAPPVARPGPASQFQ
jgi:hypothetical protein